MIEVELPLHVQSEANLREHWAVSAKRKRLHRHTACALVPFHPLPCVVTLIRIAPRALDDDNLASGFKAIRDGIADRLGVDDRSPLVQWRYSQRQGKPKQYSAIVRIQPA